jgi:hypothetical protein
MARSASVGAGIQALRGCEPPRGAQASRCRPTGRAGAKRVPVAIIHEWAAVPPMPAARPAIALPWTARRSIRRERGPAVVAVGFRAVTGIRPQPVAGPIPATAVASVVPLATLIAILHLTCHIDRLSMPQQPSSNRCCSLRFSLALPDRLITPRRETSRQARRDSDTGRRAASHSHPRWGGR